MSSTPNNYYFWLKILTCLITHQFSLIQSEEYKFCSENVTYSFSTDACPGGVLLKKPLNITESCHCFETDLRIYNQCGVGKYVNKYATLGGCSKFVDTDGDKWNGEAMLIFPTEIKGANRTESEDLCYGMPKHCVEREENMVLNTPERIMKLLKSKTTKIPKKIPVESDHTIPPVNEKVGDEESSSDSEEDESSEEEEEEEDDDDEEEEKNVTTPSAIKKVTSVNDPSPNSNNVEKPNQISKLVNPIEEARMINPLPDNDLQNLESPSDIDQNTRLTRQKLDYPKEEANRGEDAYIDNLSLLRHIMGVKEGSIPNPPPNTKTFQMIKESFRIAQKLIPNYIIKDVNLGEAYLTFRHLFQLIDEDMKVDKHLNIEDFDSIMLALDSCYNSVPTLTFKSNEPSRQIQSFFKMEQSGASETHPKIPEDRAHKPDTEDYIIGIVWKIVDMIHSACFNEFRLNSPSTQFNYLVSIENVFLRPKIQKRWYELQLLDKEAEKKLSLISHPNMKVFMENLDMIDAAVHSISGFEYFLRKPKNSSVSGRSSLPSQLIRRKRESPKSTLNQVAATGNNNPKKSKHDKGGKRRKRQNRISLVDPTAYEIWGGKGYCLQKANPNLVPGTLNVVPKLRQLCKQTTKKIR